MAFKDKLSSIVESVKDSMGMEDDEHNEMTDTARGEFKKDFNMQLRERLNERIESQNSRPSVEVWPFEDDFGHWTASHENQARAVICETPEYKDTPFCGTGYH
jgi:hypothetical protein